MPIKKQEGHGVFSLTYDDGHKAYFARVWYKGREYTEACGESLKVARDAAGSFRTEIAKARKTGEEWIPPKKRIVVEHAPTEVPTLEEFARRFLREWVGKKRSKEFYETRLKTILRHLGKKRLGDLDRGDCQRFYAQRLREAKSVTTANHDARVLRILLARAVEWNVLRVNPAAGVKREPDHERPERFLYAEEAEALLEHAKTALVLRGPRAQNRKARASERDEHWLHDLIVGALHTGLRQDNLLTLTWGRNVDLNRRVIRFSVAEVKGRKPLHIPINDTLHELLKRRREETLQNKDGRVFHRSGKAITKSSLRKPWERLLAAAGVEDFRFHDLRHTAASWMVMAGRPLHEVQRILGHSTIKMTERYAHLAPDTLRAATAALATFQPPRRNTDRDTDRDTIAPRSEASSVSS